MCLLLIVYTCSITNVTQSLSIDYSNAVFSRTASYHHGNTCQNINSNKTHALYMCLGLYIKKNFSLFNVIMRFEFIIKFVQ